MATSGKNEKEGGRPESRRRQEQEDRREAQGLVTVLKDLRGIQEIPGYLKVKVEPMVLCDTVRGPEESEGWGWRGK